MESLNLENLTEFIFMTNENITKLCAKEKKNHHSKKRNNEVKSKVNESDNNNLNFQKMITAKSMDDDKVPMTATYKIPPIVLKENQQ